MGRCVPTCVYLLGNLLPTAARPVSSDVVTTADVFLHAGSATATMTAGTTATNQTAEDKVDQLLLHLLAPAARPVSSDVVPTADVFHQTGSAMGTMTAGTTVTKQTAVPLLDHLLPPAVAGLDSLDATTADVFRQCGSATVTMIAATTAMN